MWNPAPVRILAVLGMVAAAVVLAAGALASAAPEGDAALGREVWFTKVICRECHGWGAHGVGDAGLIAANLRRTALDDAGIEVAIRCGRPGTPMPYYDATGYIDTRCYNVTREQIGDMAPNLGTALTDAEIAGLVAFIRAFGSEQPTRAECLEFLGAADPRIDCARYPDAAN